LAIGSNDTIRNHAAFIWSVADLLRGDYKQSEYGKVILPLTVLRRLDCLLEPTKAQVLAKAAQMEGKVDNLGPILERESGQKFYNTSKYDFRKLLAAPNDLAENLNHYIHSFSGAARDVLDKFDFATQIARLNRANLLYLVMSKFAEVDLHPETVSNLEMGYLYEELIRRFSELSNETAGEHFTPREVIRLMVSLLFIEDTALLTKPGTIKTIYDPACGTGGMLSVAEERLRELNPKAKLEVYGQELNAETYAICRSDMMLKGEATNIAYGNSFSEDGHPGLHVDYCLANPPFGVEWKKVADRVKDEADSKGFAGRIRRRAAPHQRRVVPVPAAHDRQDEAGRAGRLADRDRVQRLAAVHRRRWFGRIRDPPLDHRERLAGSGRRAPRPVVLQHGYLHLLLDRHQPQEHAAARQGATGRRPRHVHQDAQEPR